MENETGCQKRITASGYDYEKLIERLRNGEELTDDELDDLIYEVSFECFGKSDLASKSIKNAKGIKVSLLTLVGKIGGKDTKFLPFSLDYRKKAAENNFDNYERIIQGIKVVVNQANILLLIDQLEAANKYSEGYATLDGEINKSLGDGLSSFRSMVGIDTMLAMEKEREKVLVLAGRIDKKAIEL